MIIKLYNTWRKAKQVFVKPSLRVYFGPKIKCPYLLGPHFIANYDVMWKTKYGEVRYEDPPVFGITFFKWCLVFSLHCPVKNAYTCDDHYWESILVHVYDNKSGTLKETIKRMGIWSRFTQDYNRQSYFAVRPEYIRPELLKEYYDAVTEINKDKDDLVL